MPPIFDMVHWPTLILSSTPYATFASSIFHSIGANAEPPHTWRFQTSSLSFWMLNRIEQYLGSSLSGPDAPRPEKQGLITILLPLILISYFLTTFLFTWRYRLVVVAAAAAAAAVAVAVVVAVVVVEVVVVVMVTVSIVMYCHHWHPGEVLQDPAEGFPVNKDQHL